MDSPELKALGTTPLMLVAATKPSDKEKMMYLLAKGGDINAKDKYGNTALMYATFFDNVDTAEILLSQPGINLDSIDITGSTALMKAVLYKAQNVCNQLIKAGANLNSSNYTGETILIRSISKGTPEITSFLIQSGADVNLADNKGRTPLIVAAGYNDISLVQQLIDAGANIKRKDKAGNTAALIAAGKDAREVLSYFIKSNLLEEEEIEAVLIKAAMLGFIDCTRAILALCKHQERFAYASLIVACFKDNTELVHVCMDCHCNINNRSYFGMTSLMIACYCDSVNVAKLLISYGANVNLIDDDGITALMYAAKKNTPEIILLLLENGANKKTKDKAGKSFEDYINDFDTRTFSQMITERMWQKRSKIFQERPDNIPEGHQSFGARFEWYRKKYFERYPANKNSDIYRGAGITKQTFSKIFSKKTPDFRPKKDTVIALALGLKLTVNECEDLLQCAGYSFLTTDRKDVEARKFFCEENYDLFDWNDTMFANTGKIFFRTLVKEDEEP